MKFITTIAKSGINKIDDIATRIAGSTSAQSEIKFIERTVDVVSDTFARSPKANVFIDFSKKIASIQSADDLTILAQEFKKLDLDNVMKDELINQYVIKYESFYNQLYAGKTFDSKVLFKQIFGKDLSPEVAQSLCDKYRDILAEPCFNIFLEKLYAQVKKDFDLDYIDSFLELNPQKGKGIAFSGGASVFLDFTKMTFFEDNPLNRRKAFELMMHEINHMKQQELCLATNAQEYINAIAQRKGCAPQVVSRAIGGNTIYSVMQKHGAIPKTSPLYKRCMRYIESNKNYFSPSGNFTPEGFIVYKKQLLEAESYAVQDRAGELFYFLTGNSI